MQIPVLHLLERARYGKKAGCDIHRFNGDDIEDAIGTALLDFYTTGHDLTSRTNSRRPPRPSTAT